MLRLYDRYTTYFILVGMLFANILCFGLGLFFVNEFLIQDYDPSVFMLLLMLPGGIIFCDVLLIRSRFYARLLLRCKISTHGITCRGLGWHPFVLPWDEIRVYGIYGYSLAQHPYAIAFFSINPEERYVGKQLAKVDYSRVVFQIRPEVISALEAHMPDDMKKRFADSIRSKQDCCIRRRASHSVL